jgi:hypothetical protein
MRELEEPLTASGCAYCGRRTRYEFCSLECESDARDLEIEWELENYGA